MSNTQCRLLLLVKIIWITRTIQTTIKSYLNQCAWARLRTTSETAKWVWSFSSCACLVIYLEPKFDRRTLQHLRFFLQQINERMLVIEYVLNKNVKPLHSIGLTLSSLWFWGIHFHLRFNTISIPVIHVLSCFSCMWMAVWIVTIKLCVYVHVDINTKMN